LNRYFLLSLMLVVFFIDSASSAENVSAKFSAAAKITQRRATEKTDSVADYLVRTANPEHLLSLLPELGAQGRSYTGGVVGVRGTAQAILRLAQQQDVLAIGRSGRLFPLLDVSVPDIGGDIVRQGVGLDSPYTGHGVLVAVIDNGLDFDHPDFTNEDGSTRILWLWDQAYEGGTSPEEFGYGLLCSALEINRGHCDAADEDPIEGIYSLGHGTHITGIAAGNDAVYTGVAPEALIIGVRTYFEEDNVLDAISFVSQKADQLGLPLVINLSLGTQEGPHDGTSLFEQALIEYLGPGKIAVAAAGNHGPNSGGANYFHVSYTAGDEKRTEIRPTTFITGDDYLFVDVWYPADGQLELGIAATDGNEILAQTSFVAEDEEIFETLFDADGLTIAAVAIANSVSPLNGLRNVVIEISDGDTGANVGGKRWHLVTRSESDTAFHAWLASENAIFDNDSGVLTKYVGDQPYEMEFVAGDSEYSITMPATNDRIIAVGSYVSKASWIAANGGRYSSDPVPAEQSISSFSSRGPTMDGRIKPDLTAPGENISSSLSEDFSVSSRLKTDDHHFITRGTSQSSPHVAGAVACMLERNRNLTVDEILDLLADNARQDSYTGSLPNNTFGYGKLDLEAVFGDPNFAKDDYEDLFPPIITEVIVTTGPGTALVEWRTDELADSHIQYWMKGRGGEKQEKTVATYYFDHEIVLQDLVESAEYEFNICSIDLEGNESCEEATVYIEPGPPKGDPPCPCGCSFSGNREVRGDCTILAILLLLLIYRKRRKTILVFE
jgi:minor extracellular serine protease Vpr